MTSTTNEPAPPPKLTQEYRRVFGILLALGVLTLPILPPPANALVLIGLIVGAAALLATDRTLLRDLTRGRAIALPIVRMRTRLQHAVEIGIVLIILLFSTTSLQDWSPEARIAGPEFSYLINSGAIAARVYELSGAIPLWNPFMARGEPLLESPFGFVLNPIMTLPIFLFGAVQGTKLAVLLHIGIMGIGGWLMAYALKLRAPSRILSALLMGGAGGMAGAIGYGFYQMSLSQAYVPWVYAGLFGILFTQNRRWVAVLVAAAALLIFAGTFWYVLPTAISCALIALFGLVRRDERGWYLNLGAITRLVWAGALLIGVSAVRFIPQLVNHDMIAHPRAALDTYVDFLTVATPYFVPEVPKPFENIAMHYQYIMPPAFALLLLTLRGWALFRRDKPKRAVGYGARIVLPGALLIILFTVWAQEGTPFLRWLYGLIPTLGEWRFLGRMLAASLPWFAIIAAIWLDDILIAFGRALRDPEGRPAIPIRLGGLVAAAAVSLSLIGAGAAGLDIVQNWGRMAGVEPTFTFERPLVYYLRERFPNRFLQVWTGGFFVYLPFYETLTRASFGNPDYRPDPVDPTLGTREAMRFPPEFGVGVDGFFMNWVISNGFRVIPETIEMFSGAEWVWEQPEAPSYVFAVHYNDLVEQATPLTRYEALPIDTYSHHIDWIHVSLGDYTPGFILVAQEVAFPGWEVEINGQPAQLESVGGLIGVRLPDKAPGAPPTDVIFRYAPRLLYASGWLTIASVGVFAVYALRLDRLVRRRKDEPPTAPEPIIAVMPEPEPEPIPVPVPAAEPEPEPEPAPIPVVAAAPTAPPKRRPWFAYLILSALCLAVMALAPMPYPTLALLAFVSVSVYLALSDIAQNRAPASPKPPRPAVRPAQPAAPRPPRRPYQPLPDEFAAVERPESLRLNLTPAAALVGRLIASVWRSGRLFGAIGVGSLLLSVSYWQDPRWGEVMPTAGLLTLIGMLAVIRASLLLGVAPPALVPTAAPMDRGRWRGVVPFLLGVVMLFILADYSARYFIQDYEAIPRDAQMALLFGGAALVAYGLGGAPRLSLRPLLNLRRWDWAIIAITAGAFSLRVWDLDFRIRVSVDEIHSVNALRGLVWDPNTLMLTGISGLTPFTWVFPYLNLGGVSIFGASLAGFRMINVILAVLIIPGTYLFARTLFDRKTGLIAALVLSLMAVHFHWSQVGNFQHGDPLAAIYGLYFLARGLKYNRRFDWAAGGALMGLTVYFYEAGRLLFIPLAVSWLVAMLILMPGRLRWLRAQWRGILIFMLAAAATSGPVYYVSATTPNPFAGRMDTVSGTGFFTDLVADGFNVNDALELANHVGTPMVFLIAPPPWNFEPMINPGLIAGVFLIGVALLIRRLRAPSIVILGWMAATALGNSLMVDRTMQFRYILVWSAIAITVAVGARYLVPLLLPPSRFWVRRALPIAVCIAVAFGSIGYYFATYLPYFNRELRNKPGFRDDVDVALRSLDFPPDTDVIVLARPRTDPNVSGVLLAFLTHDQVGLMSRQPFEFGAKSLLGLPRDRNYAFYVEPTDSDTMNLIQQYFPNVEPPAYSDYPFIPPREEFILLFAPASDWTPPSKK